MTTAMPPHLSPAALKLVSAPESGSASSSTSISLSNCPAPAGIPCSCLDSTDLLRGQKAVEISHNGSTYRLQATRLGKLILTK